MSVLGKLMFWKGPDIDKDFEMKKEFTDMSKDFGIGGKETGFGMGKDSLGMEMDRTPGLGGTGDMSSQGYGADTGIKPMGFEHEEPSPLKSAPLEKRYYQEIPQQQPYGQGLGQQQYGQQVYQRDIFKEVEILSAKLDSIKALLDSINHRLDAMERQQTKKGRMEW